MVKTVSKTDDINDNTTNEEITKIIIQTLEKNFGKGVAMRLGDQSYSPVEVISTGSIAIDMATGVGGIPRGKITEFSGEESSAKSTVALCTIANAQKQGLNAMYIDLENCIAEKSLVYNADTKTYIPIEDLYSNGGKFTSIGIDNDNKITERQSMVSLSSNREVFEIKISGGRRLRLTDNHRILTNNGYKEVKEISVNDIVYIPQKINNENDTLISKYDENNYRLLGYFIANGSKSYGVDISTTDKDVIKDLSMIAEQHNCHIKIRKASVCFSRNNKESYKISKEILEELYIQNELTIKELSLSLNIPSSTIVKRLEKYGLKLNTRETKIRANLLTNKKRDLIIIPTQIINERKNSAEVFLNSFPFRNYGSKQRFIPPKLTKSQLRQVLIGMFMSDGTVVDIEKNRRYTFSYSTSSYRLALDTQAALQQFGIYSEISTSNKQKNNEEYYDTNYNIIVNGKLNLSLFQKEFNLFGYKGNRINKALNSNIATRDSIKTQDNLICLSIKSIKSIGYMNTYDISVAKNDFNEQNLLVDGVFIHNSFDKAWAQKCGVDTVNLIVSQPEHGEKAFDVLHAATKIAKYSKIGIICFDSIDAIVPKAELEGKAEDHAIATKARLIGQELRKLTTIVGANNVAILFCNQIRSGIGSFGSYKVTSGGKALKFYAHMRIELKQTGKVGTTDRSIGTKHEARVVKNKVAAPFRKATFEILFNEGMSKEGNLIDVGLELGIIEQSGAWFKYSDELIGQGREATRNYLKLNKDVAEDITNKIKAQISADVWETEPEEIEDEDNGELSTD